jgi:ATP phosphoribosyltransferase
MSKFNAATAVESLEYDFTAYGGEAGLIPEPSTDQIDQFFTDLRNIVKQVQGLKAQAESAKSGEMTQEQMDEVLAAMDDVSIKKFQTEMTEAVSALCSNQPSVEQITKLPYRVLQAFIQWVSGEFRPKANTMTQ